MGLPLAVRLSRVAEGDAVSRERHAAAITRRGLVLHGAWGSDTFRFRCTTEVPSEDFDFILILSKSNDTREICSQCRNLIRDWNLVSLGERDRERRDNAWIYHTRHRDGRFAHCPGPGRNSPAGLVLKIGKPN